VSQQANVQNTLTFLSAFLVNKGFSEANSQKQVLEGRVCPKQEEEQMWQIK